MFVFSVSVYRSSVSALHASLPVSSSNSSSLTSLPFYRSISSILSSLSGISISHWICGDEMGMEKNKVKLLLQPIGSQKQAEMGITFTGDWTKFTEINCQRIQKDQNNNNSLVNNSASSLEFDDIIEHGIHKQDINFIARECLYRIKNC